VPVLANLLETRNLKLETGVGAVAQLGERLVCNQEATGSIPVSSTKISLMLGVNTTTESVSRLEKVAWRRTLGWRHSGVAHSESE
jgi:hypothetical protein